MTSFVIQRSDGQWLTRDLEWAADCAPRGLFFSPHRDVALNQLLEINSKDPNLRATVITCSTDSKSRPLLPQDSPVTTTTELDLITDKP